MTTSNVERMTYEIPEWTWELRNEVWWPQLPNGTSPEGSYHVDVDGPSWRYCYDEYYDEDTNRADSVDEAKAAAHEHWKKRLVLELVPSQRVAELEDCLSRMAGAPDGQVSGFVRAVCQAVLDGGTNTLTPGDPNKRIATLEAERAVLVEEHKAAKNWINDNGHQWAGATEDQRLAYVAARAATNSLKIEGL